MATDLNTIENKIDLETSSLTNKSLISKIFPWVKSKEERARIKAEVLASKEYLFHYNKQKARDLESKIMNSIEEHNREIVINDTFSRIYYLSDIPDVFGYQYILQILNSGLPLNISYHITATNKGGYLRMLRTRRAILIGSQNERQKRGSDNDPEIEKEILDLDHLIEDIINDGKRAFLVGIYATITGNSKEELVDYCHEFEDITSQRDMVFYPKTFQQKASLPSVLPLATDTINEKINLQTDAVVELFPFLSRNIQDDSGFYLGISRTNYNSLIIFDPFKARNANIMILGTSGSGKSVTSKSLLLKLVMRQVQCIIIDPEGEYVPITKKCGGEVISFGEGSGLNIFDLDFKDNEARRNHIAVLKNFFKFIIDEHKYSDSKLDLILTKLYESKELNMKNFVSIAEGENIEFLEDLQKLTNGSLSGIFDSTQKLDFKRDVICFDLSNLGNDNLKLPAMYLVASIVDNLIDRADQKRMIFIDEAHLFLNREFTREFYIRLQKTARKRQAGVVSITQNAEDFKEEQGTKTILTQAETVILLKQHTSSINFLQRMQIFDLSKDEYNQLFSLDKGEAILFREQEHIYIKIDPFENEWEYIST